jgi:hypothetical protein
MVKMRENDEFFVWFFDMIFLAAASPMIRGLYMGTIRSEMRE